MQNDTVVQPADAYSMDNRKTCCKITVNRVLEQISVNGLTSEFHFLRSSANGPIHTSSIYDILTDVYCDLFEIFKYLLEKSFQALRL